MPAKSDFPAFVKTAGRMIHLSDRSEGCDYGVLFESPAAGQATFWCFPDGGESEEHSHAYDEYCVVISGSYKGIVGGEEVTVSAGEEILIPAGVKHGGIMSPGYRAIDVFGGKRF